MDQQHRLSGIIHVLYYAAMKKYESTHEASPEDDEDFLLDSVPREGIQISLPTITEDEA